MSSATARVSSMRRSPAGTRLPEQRQRPQGEGDVGGHGDPPTRRTRPSVVHRRVHQTGAGHPAQRPGHRHRRRPRVAELPGPVLSSDLEADHEEEDGHQATVDPRLHGGEPGEGRPPDVHGVLPQRRVARRPDWAVRPPQGHADRDHQHPTPGDVRREEVPEHGGDRPARRSRAWLGRHCSAGAGCDHVGQPRRQPDRDGRRRPPPRGRSPPSTGCRRRRPGGSPTWNVVRVNEPTITLTSTVSSNRSGRR